MFDLGLQNTSTRPAHSSFLRTAELFLLCFAMLATHGDPGVSLAAALALRSAAIVSALMNEWAHLGVATWLGYTREVWTLANLTGHRSLRLHAATLLPLTLDRRGDLWVEIPNLTTEAARRVREHGFWLSAALTLSLVAGIFGLAISTHWLMVAVGCAAGSGATIVASFLTDLCRTSPFAASRSHMGCGNLTLLGRLLPDETSAVPQRVADLLKSMLHVTQLRGAQSGGGAIQVESAGQARQTIVKCLNSKRADLSARLTRGVVRARKGRAYGNAFVIQTHVRFATSGPATRQESHPFRFVEIGQHGPRRVFRPDVLEPAACVRAVETAITHNGDVHALSIGGVRIPHPQLGYILAHVLEVENRWSGDSPSLAGALELFLTRGLWLESLRLAFLETIAAPPPELAQLAPGQVLRDGLAGYAFPSRSALQEPALIAEQVWVRTQVSPRARLLDRAALAARLSLALRASPVLIPNGDLLDTLAIRTVDNFLDNDLLRAAQRLLVAAEGTFGCVLSSTLEPSTVVAFVRGQPLSIAVQSETGLVAIASERNALRVRDASGQAVFDTRLDLDMAHTEIARVMTGDVLQPELTLFSLAEQRYQTREELEHSGRLVALKDHPLTGPLPSEPKSRVRQVC